MPQIDNSKNALLIQRRKTLIVFLLLLVGEYGFAQKNTFHLDSVLNFQEIPITFGNVTRDVFIKAENDKVFIAFIKGDMFHLYEYIHKSRTLIKEKYKLQKSLKGVTAPEDLVETDDFLYTLIQNRIICISKSKKKEFCSFSCGRSEYLFLSDYYLITGFYYNYHPNDSRHKAGLRKFDFSGNQIDSIFLNVPFPEYTHYLPKKLISYSGKSFVFPTFDGLNFIFIDSNFRDIDTLQIPTFDYDKNWVLPSKSLSESINRNVSGDLSLFWGLLDNSNYRSISRIEHAQFIDSNKLFIRWYSHDSTKKFSNRYTIRLSKKSDIWQVVDSTGQIETPLPFNTELNIYSGGMPLLSHNGLTVYSSEFIYQLKIDIPYIEDLPYKEYYKKKTEKEKSLEPVISLWIFQYD
jgi:hypothetical protein